MDGTNDSYLHLMSAYVWLTVNRSLPSGAQAILSAIRYSAPSCFFRRTFFTILNTSSDDVAMVAVQAAAVECGDM